MGCPLSPVVLSAVSRTEQREQGGELRVLESAASAQAVREGDFGAVTAQRDNQWVRAASVRQLSRRSRHVEAISSFVNCARGVDQRTHQATRAVRGCHTSDSMLLDRLQLDCLP